MNLADSVAVVSGGASGIGLACSRALSGAGCRVAMGDLDLKLAKKMSAELAEQTGNEVLPIGADATDSGQCSNLIQQALDAFGQLDILINVAGGSLETKPVLELSESIWQKTLDVNLNSVFYCSRAFAKWVIQQGRKAAIVNTSSMFATVNAPGLSAYAVSKAAVSQLTRSLALEWAPHNIRVNAVGPSHVDTAKMRRKIDQGLVDEAAAVARVPMGRICQPEEVADLVLYLCSDQSSFITGQTVVIDGGYTLG